MCSFLQEHPSYCGRRVFLGSVRRYERELKRAELKWWEMDDDIPVGCEHLHRAKLAREARKEANRRKANRYCRTRFKEEKLLRKEWDNEFKNRLRHAPGPGQVFSSVWLTAQQAPLPSHAKSALIIIIDDDDDDDEVIFAGTGQIPALDGTAAPVVVDDHSVVSFLPSLDPNT
jgi:hypothetical protein